MNTQQYIFEYLKEHQSVVVPNFGEFLLKDSAAYINLETSTILPPGKEIIFKENFKIFDEKIEQYITSKSNKTNIEVKNDIKNLTDFWKKKLNEHQELEVPELGKFYFSEDIFFFKGRKIQKEDPKNYGLEEINISNLKQYQNSTKIESEKNNYYQFNNSILWLFLLIIPVLGILVLGIMQNEKLFGKKSFENLTVKNSTHRIENDTLHNNIKKDSLKIPNGQK